MWSYSLLPGAYRLKIINATCISKAAIEEWFDEAQCKCLNIYACMHSWLVLLVGTVNCLLASEVSVLNDMRMEYITIFKPGVHRRQAGTYLAS